jgi:hypothetical protein
MSYSYVPMNTGISHKKNNKLKLGNFIIHLLSRPVFLDNSGASEHSTNKTIIQLNNNGHKPYRFRTIPIRKRSRVQERSE